MQIAFDIRYRASALLALVCVLCLPAVQAGAWGRVGHHYINNLAIDCLPRELKPLYESNRAWIIEHSTDPDEWRNADRAEGPHHFIDMDTWGDEVARNFPQDYWVACGIYGKDAIDKNGVVPWRIGEFYGKLVTAFQKKDARAIVEISAWLGHYAADVHVPFHATANYDGQSTGQRGIHARFESVMVEQLIKPEDLKPVSATPIKDPVAAAFQWARASLSLCPDILAADKRGVLKDAEYGYNYYTEFAISARPIAIRRLDESAHDVASLWYSAWIAAGKPEVPGATDIHAGEPLDKPTHDPNLAAKAVDAAKPADKQ